MSWEATPSLFFLTGLPLVGVREERVGGWERESRGRFAHSSLCIYYRATVALVLSPACTLILLWLYNLNHISTHLIFILTPQYYCTNAIVFEHRAFNVMVQVKWGPGMNPNLVCCPKMGRLCYRHEEVQLWGDTRRRWPSTNHAERPQENQYLDLNTDRKCISVLLLGMKAWVDW